MKFTVALIVLLSISTSWASKEKKVEEQKDKREAAIGYPSSGHSSQTVQIQPSLGHDDANTISIGAGYSVGGAKGALASYGGHGPLSGLQYEGLSSNGGHTLQLPPITLQPGHGGFVAGDISQIMSQLSHGLSTGAIQLQPIGGSYHSGGSQGGYEASPPQYSFASPKYQQYTISDQSQASVPTYAAGTKGLGSYGSGSTGPVLFNPAASHGIQSVPSYGGGSLGHSFGDSGVSLGNSGHSFGSFKNFAGGYGGPSKASFKPSAFLGASVQSEPSHGISGLSTHAIPSFGQSFPGHGPISSGQSGFAASLGGFGGGSSKYGGAPSYLPPKSGGFGSSLESISSFSGNGHLSSPPGTTYGIPTASYGLSGSAHAASSNPQYYISSSKHAAPSSFGEGSSSYRAPMSGHSSFSSGSKYNFGGHGGGSFGSRYASPKDSHGAFSENVYNTIKYSEELKPRNH